MSDNNPQNPDRSKRDFLKYTSLMGVMASGVALNTSAQAPLGTEQFACQFSQIPGDLVYLNSGTEGSMPDCVLAGLDRYNRKWARHPTDSYESDKNLGKHQHYNREAVAKALSVKKNHIVLTDNTTMGMSMAIMGLNFKAGEKVVCTDHEHNAIASPLAVLAQKTGLSIHKQSFPHPESLKKLTVEQLLEQLVPDNNNTRGATALCVSHVYPTTGLQLPLKALRKRADQLNIKYLIVDGAQAFGMLDLSQGDNAITYADFYACPGHKWLNAPPGTGVLYLKNAAIRPPEFYPVLSQRMAYLQADKRFPMAEALQVRGCSHAPGFAAMLTAIDFTEKLGGFQVVEAHIQALSRSLKDFILAHSPRAMVSPHHDPRLQTGITAFHPFSWDKPNKIYHDKATADFIVAELIQKNIKIRSIGFANPNDASNKYYVLRVSTALFNTPKQLGYFQSALKDVLNSTRKCNSSNW